MDETVIKKIPLIMWEADESVPFIFLVSFFVLGISVVCNNNHSN